jgi:amidohydrolase
VSIEDIKTRVMAEIDKFSPQLRELALKIHANPELGFEETKAAEWLTGFLTGQGFAVTRGVCNMPTAFDARYGQGKPTVAFLAEYDALPGIGHGCGHNLIATASVGAALGAKVAVAEYGGSIAIIGTPAEEMYGGKAIMADRGWFRDLDAAMLVHPDNSDIATAQALACQNLYIEFIGKPSHAAARPEAGINALDAILLSFNAINALRQHIRSSSRVHGIITDGGQAVNVVPAYTAATFLIRARDDAYLDVLKDKVLNCFVGAATATGATLKYKWDEVRYATMRNNIPLARLYQQNMRPLKRNPLLTETRDAFGSTDMGNVSHLVPSIQPYVGIARGVLIHSPEFAAAAASEDGIHGMLDAAKAMAATTVDLLADPVIMNKVREDFNRGK